MPMPPKVQESSSSSTTASSSPTSSFLILPPSTSRFLLLLNFHSSPTSLTCLTHVRAPRKDTENVRWTKFVCIRTKGVQKGRSQSPTHRPTDRRAYVRACLSPPPRWRMRSV
eukprot:GHVU01137714.1.p5 GENE.GHVU01137714.1~~GHVU01137714.1.p5  ORF type:complete len:112 (+),score=10.02 GHVU01137714.1:1414-1749(+)